MVESELKSILPVVRKPSVVLALILVHLDGLGIVLKNNIVLGEIMRRASPDTDLDTFARRHCQDVEAVSRCNLY